MSFRAPALHLHRNQRLEEDPSKIFNLFINKMDRTSANQFHRVHMNDLTFLEYLLTLNILPSDIDILNGNITGEIARRSVQKYEKNSTTAEIQQRHMLREQP